MQERFIKFLYEQHQEPYLKIECSDDISDMFLTCLTHCEWSVGYVQRIEGFYEDSSVINYLKFFAQLHRSMEHISYAMEAMHLQELRYVKLRRLSEGQKKRVAVAREILKQPDIFFLQEPINDVDEDSCRWIMQWLESVGKQQKQVIMTSRSLKQLLLLPGVTYYVTPQDIQLIDQEEHEGPASDMPNHLLEKISAKHEDKILLFNPNDIDYFESMDGKCYVHVRKSSFVCSGTLDELETKLKRYGFYRSHRSYLVNMQKVSEVIRWTRNSYSLKLENCDDVKIPLSKGRIDEMKEIYHF